MTKSIIFSVIIFLNRKSNCMNDVLYRYARDCVPCESPPKKKIHGISLVFFGYYATFPRFILYMYPSQSKLGTNIYASWAKSGKSENQSSIFNQHAQITHNTVIQTFHKFPYQSDCPEYFWIIARDPRCIHPYLSIYESLPLWLHVQFSP